MAIDRERVERAWAAWAALATKAERAEFLTMMRAAYARQRKEEARATPGARISSLGELTLAESDLAMTPAE